MNRASESNPDNADNTAKVTNSASDNLGAIPTTGRCGNQCGFDANKSSIRTYSAVTRVSKSGFIPRSSKDQGLVENPEHGHPHPPNGGPHPLELLV